MTREGGYLLPHLFKSQPVLEIMSRGNVNTLNISNFIGQESLNKNSCSFTLSVPSHHTAKHQPIVY